ncbi:DUF998 domain-containing protein [Lysobacter cavernae]|uniref:DUF998 domain-containing protein n=1 Tax=Lysobacter cavernae TaxID=1685901 RepID=A0ABV7RK04_9GAMM
MTRLSWFDRYAGVLAAVCCAVAVIGFGAAFEVYSHAQHPLALLGAHGVQRALAFNLFAFVIPGAVATAIALRLQARLSKAPQLLKGGMAGRIGGWLLAISALAFTAQGLLPVDPAELDGGHSQWHATAWTLWWLAFLPGALLLGWSVRSVPGWRRTGQALIVAALLAIVLNAMPAALLPGPIAQRLLLVLWWLCFVAVSRSRRERDTAR